MRPDNSPRARLTVLSGPSGVGKGTVVREVRALGADIWISVSCTTRRPRPGEREGREYFFRSEDEFQAMVESGAMLEWARFAGNLYGTPREPVEQRLAAGIPVLLEIDLQGARQVRAAMPGSRLVFLAPPDVAELDRRLTGRGTEDEQTLAARRALAEVELAAAEEFDTVVVNDDVRRAAVELVGLVDSAV
ncbi:guanylate kinase [Jatrophihabitans sp. YIM 134969]